MREQLPVGAATPGVPTKTLNGVLKDLKGAKTVAATQANTAPNPVVTLLFLISPDFLRSSSGIRQCHSDRFPTGVAMSVSI